MRLLVCVPYPILESLRDVWLTIYHYIKLVQIF